MIKLKTQTKKSNYDTIEKLNFFLVLVIVQILTFSVDSLIYVQEQKITAYDGFGLEWAYLLIVDKRMPITVFEIFRYWLTNWGSIFDDRHPPG